MPVSESVHPVLENVWLVVETISDSATSWYFTRTVLCAWTIWSTRSTGVECTETMMSMGAYHHLSLRQKHGYYTLTTVVWTHRPSSLSLSSSSSSNRRHLKSSKDTWFLFPSNRVAGVILVQIRCSRIFQ